MFHNGIAKTERISSNNKSANLIDRDYHIIDPCQQVSNTIISISADLGPIRSRGHVTPLLWTEPLNR